LFVDLSRVAKIEKPQKVSAKKAMLYALDNTSPKPSEEEFDKLKLAIQLSKEKEDKDEDEE